MRAVRRFSLAGIEAISVTGNMHSFFLVCQEGQPITDIIHGRMSGGAGGLQGGLSYVWRVCQWFLNPGFHYQVQGEFRLCCDYPRFTLLEKQESGGQRGFAGCSLHFCPRPRLSTRLIHGSAPTEGAGITDHSLAHSSGLKDPWKRKKLEP